MTAVTIPAGWLARTIGHRIIPSELVQRDTNAGDVNRFREIASRSTLNQPVEDWHITQGRYDLCVTKTLSLPLSLSLPSPSPSLIPLSSYHIASCKWN